MKRGPVAGNERRSAPRHDAPPGWSHSSPGTVGLPGEVLLQSIDALATGLLWTGAPVPFPLALPLQPSLVGQRVHLQGLLVVDRMGLTRGLSVLIGS